jgi:hypothetical protein
MYAPVLRKVRKNDKTLIERAMLGRGEVDVKVGDVVKPFDQLGSCKASHSRLILPDDFVPISLEGLEKAYENDVIGKIKNKTVKAPFGGRLFKFNYYWVLEESARDYDLLSGVWGTVKSTMEGSSVLLETQTTDLLLPIATGLSRSGELVVFPNPSDLLLHSFLDKFTKDSFGKIFYIGNHAELSSVRKAKNLGLKALLTGSITHEALIFAKRSGLSVGVFEGFGNINTSEVVFKELNKVSNRFVLFDSERNLLRIPMPEVKPSPKVRPLAKAPAVVAKATTKAIKKVQKGQIVQVLQAPNFGKTAQVDTVLESSILIKLAKDSKPVEVRVPNFFILE